MHCKIDINYRLDGRFEVIADGETVGWSSKISNAVAVSKTVGTSREVTININGRSFKEVALEPCKEITKEKN